MNMNFSNNSEFKTLLRKKQQEIHQRTNDGVQETAQFQKMKSLLISARKKFPETDYRHILIDKGDLMSLCSNAEDKMQELFTCTAFLTNRTVRVDSQMRIVNYDNAAFPDNPSDARRYFSELTKDGELIGFHVAPDASLHFYINGIEFGDGLFYTSEARKGYEELKTMEHLDEVLELYRIHLEKQDTYVKFFVSTSALRAFYQISKPDIDENRFLKNHRQLLRNRPEVLFHDDLRNFIKRHMRVVIARESMLENRERLDIELLDEAGKDLYFIEIKWVGQSINANGNGYGVEFREKPRINPDAVKQVVGYIDELHKDNKNIKLGYLAVFDARNNTDLPDTGENISIESVPEKIQQHFHRFRKLKDFKVKNISPR